MLDDPASPDFFAPLSCGELVDRARGLAKGLANALAGMSVASGERLDIICVSWGRLR